MSTAGGVSFSFFFLGISSHNYTYFTNYIFQVERYSTHLHLPSGWIMKYKYTINNVESEYNNLTSVVICERKLGKTQVLR
jgi:hypothetical protein